MTRGASEHAAPPPPEAPNYRARHAMGHRRARTLEKVAVALVLLAALGTTVLLLGLQWLGNQGNASTFTTRAPGPTATIPARTGGLNQTTTGPLGRH